jgi:hypothetical protein
VTALSSLSNTILSSVTRCRVSARMRLHCFEASNGDDGVFGVDTRKPGAVANMLFCRNRKSAGKRVVWVSASLLSLAS